MFTEPCFEFVIFRKVATYISWAALNGNKGGQHRQSPLYFHGLFHSVSTVSGITSGRTLRNRSVRSTLSMDTVHCIVATFNGPYTLYSTFTVVYVLQLYQQPVRPLYSLTNIRLYLILYQLK